MNQALNALIRLMQQGYGRDVSCYDAAFLAKALKKRLAASAFPTAGAYLDHLAENGAEAEAFARSLTITYSEFFRNPLTFAMLEQLILPGLSEERTRAGRAEIRVWSAGCAAGQEAYSIAILLDELAGAPGANVPYRIFATDSHEAELASARQGTYAATAVQNVRLKHLRGYFVLAGDSYTVAPRLRERVDFSAYDLLDEGTTCPPASIFGDFDLVMCSNLLFYYRPEIRQRILNGLYRCLAPHGYLVTGEAEKVCVEQAGGFRAVAPPAAVFQKARSINH